MQVCEIVVRPARASDWASRAELVRAGIAEYDFDAFILFFFQELTLQVCVLSGAILFIFLSASLWACAMIVPALAVLISLGVFIGHRAMGDSHAQRIRTECFGLVAEYCGPLATDPRTVRTRVVSDERSDKRRGRVVATLSVSEYWGPRQSAWIHDLVVDKRWRRRGVARALVEAATSHCVCARQQSLEALVSHAQSAARALLHHAGWQLRGTAARAAAGGALAVPVAALGLELPPPDRPRPLADYSAHEAAPDSRP